MLHLRPALIKDLSVTGAFNIRKKKIQRLQTANPAWAANQTEFSWTLKEMCHPNTEVSLPNTVKRVLKTRWNYWSILGLSTYTFPVYDGKSYVLTRTTQEENKKHFDSVYLVKYCKQCNLLKEKKIQTTCEDIHEINTIKLTMSYTFLMQEQKCLQYLSPINSTIFFVNGW